MKKIAKRAKQKPAISTSAASKKTWAKIWLRNIIWLLVVMAIVLAASGKWGNWGFDYWQSWVFVLTSGVCNFASTMLLKKHAPNLLARRMKGGAKHETRGVQKIIMAFGQLGFIAMLILPALGVRFGLWLVPAWATWLGNGLVVVGSFMTYIVFRQNEFAGATITNFKNQRLSDSGLYAVVRHPMYLASLITCAAIPVALGSTLGEIGVAVWFGCIIFRILDEEKLMHQTFKNYKTYCQQTRHRLIPYVW